MDYLTLNPAESQRLAEILADPDIRSVQLSRRDSLDNLCPTGFLVVSIVTDDDQFRVAIGETGSQTFWT